MLRRLARVLAVLFAAGFAFVTYIYLTLPDVRVLARTNPTRTAFMDMRRDEAAREGKALRHVHRWVPYSRISQNLKRAVLVAEDDAFWDHDGVDYVQLKASIDEALERGAPTRGASTITQQLAKNLYLSSDRNPLTGGVRKLRELIIARRLETALPKARILEIYLNVIEWGDGIWGAEAAARTYFGTSAASLSADQSALLAAAIINPRLLNPGRPSARLLRRQKMIRGRMGGVTPPVHVPVVATEELSTPVPAEPESAEFTVQGSEPATTLDTPSEPATPAAPVSIEPTPQPQ